MQNDAEAVAVVGKAAETATPKEAVKAPI